MLVCIRDEWEGWEDHGVLVKMISDNGYRLVGDNFILKWQKEWGLLCDCKSLWDPSVRFKLRRLKSQRRPLIEAVGESKFFRTQRTVNRWHLPGMRLCRANLTEKPHLYAVTLVSLWTRGLFTCPLVWLTELLSGVHGFLS